MEFRELQYIAAIADSGSITRAAQALYVSQPTLTVFLQKLEKDLGLKLFERVHNRYQATYAGQKYLESVRKILEEKEQLDAELEAIRAGQLGELNLAFPPSRAGLILPAVLPRFQESYPQIKVNLFSGNTRDCAARLYSGWADLAFLILPPSPESRSEVLYQEELVLITAPDHPLAAHAEPREGSRHPWIDLRLFRDENFLLMPAGSHSRNLAEKLFASKELAPRITYSAMDITTLLGLVSYQCGVTLLMDKSFSLDMFSRRVSLFSVGTPQVTCDCAVHYRADRPLPACAKAFLELIKEHVAEL